MRRLPLIALLALPLVAAACGKPGPPPVVLYDRQASAACLEAKPGVTLGGALDFVASTATGGAFKARLSGNTVTVAFGSTQQDADNIDEAYVRFAAKNVGVTDILRQQSNVVMLWKQHPEDAQLALVQGCLTAAS